MKCCLPIERFSLAFLSLSLWVSFARFSFIIIGLHCYAMEVICVPQREAVGGVAECVSDNCVPKNSKISYWISKGIQEIWPCDGMLQVYWFVMTTKGGGGTARVGGGAGVILPFAAITTKSIIHLYKLKAKKFAHKRHNLVVKCCHGHCCSPVRGCLISLSLPLLLPLPLLLSLLTFSLAN